MWTAQLRTHAAYFFLSLSLSVSQMWNVTSEKWSNMHIWSAMCGRNMTPLSNPFASLNFDNVRAQENDVRRMRNKIYLFSSTSFSRDDQNWMHITIEMAIRWRILNENVVKVDFIMWKKRSKSGGKRYGKYGKIYYQSKWFTYLNLVGISGWNLMGVWNVCANQQSWSTVKTRPNLQVEIAKKLHWNIYLVVWELIVYRWL